MPPRLTALFAFLLCGWAEAALFPQGNCSTGWDWTLNPAGQTPCQVANQLTSDCHLHFDTPNTPPGFPTDATNDHCLCNTIIYSLIYACNGCQNMLPPNAITWAAWLSMNNCTDESNETRVNVTTTALHAPLPTGADVVVPGWAFLPNMSDPAGAWPSQTIVLMAIVTAKNSDFPDSTFIGPTSTPPVETATSSPAPASSPTKKSSASGAIVGGVIGGLAVLAIFLLAIVLLMRHRAKRSRQQARKLAMRTTGPPSDPFRWLPDESLPTHHSSEIAMEPLHTRRTSSPPPRAPPVVAQPAETRSMAESSGTVSRNPYSVKSVLSRADSTVSRNPFFQIAAAEGTLTHQDIERHTTSSSRVTSQHFESLI